MTQIRCMIDAVRKALASDYAAQVAAYIIYGGNSFLKRVLSSGETKLNRERVKAELLALLQSQESVKSVIVPAKEKAVSSKDDQEKKMYQEINSLFDRQRNLHGKMSTTGAASERAKIRQEIISLEFQIRKKYDDLKYYKEFGFVPSTYAELSILTTPTQITNKIASLNTLISRAKRGTKPKEKLPEWEAQRMELKRRLEHEFA